MAKILVIGGSGSLGKETVNYLSQRHKVTATYLNNKIDSGEVNYVKLNSAIAEDFDRLEKNYDSVVLVSGAMPASMEGYQPQRYIDVNVTGTLNTLEFCRKNKIPKIIFVMTFSDVSSSFYSGIPIKSDDKRTLTLTGDHAVYAISKVAACDLLEHYHQEYGLQTIIFRIPTVYCCDSNVNYYVDGVERTKAYVKMIRSIVQDGKVELWGDPSNAKDMPYVKDFSRLIYAAVESGDAQGIYNAGTGSPVSLDTFVDALIDVFGEGRDIAKIYRPGKPSQPNFTFDMSATERDFSYQPQYGVKEMFVDIKNNTNPDIWMKNI